MAGFLFAGTVTGSLICIRTPSNNPVKRFFQEQ